MADDPVVDTDVLLDAFNDMVSLASGLQAQRNKLRTDLAKRDAEIDRLQLDIQGYQVGGGYEKGHEHGSTESAKLRAERDEALAELADIHGDDAPSRIDLAAETVRLEADLDALYANASKVVRRMARRTNEIRRDGRHWYMQWYKFSQFVHYAPDEMLRSYREAVRASVFGREPLPDPEKSWPQAAGQPDTDERTADDGSNEVRGRRVPYPSVDNVRGDEDVRPARGGGEEVGRGAGEVGQPDTEATEQGEDPDEGDCTKCGAGVDEYCKPGCPASAEDVAREDAEHTAARFALLGNSTQPCTSAYTVGDQTYRCALSVSHPHSLHVSNISRIEATWSDDEADPVPPTEPRVWRDIHEQEWTERPDGLILTYQGFAFSRSQLEELVGPLTEVVEDGAQ